MVARRSINALTRANAMESQVRVSLSGGILSGLSFPKPCRGNMWKSGRVSYYPVVSSKPNSILSPPTPPTHR